MALAQYTFSSLVRHGFQPNADARAHIEVTVAGEEPYARDVDMLTAGDVTGVGGSQVIRTWPRDGIANVEPNYLALVEFDDPAVPWLFSRPTADGKVHPWLCLAVIDETELDDDPLSPAPLGTKVTIHVDQLPNPADAWLWAHGQFLGTETVPADPSRSLSRLICPRRLRPDRRYIGCVVPTLAATREAALQGDPGDLRLSTDWAWRPGQGVVTLPVFHFFRFSTGPAGDFEALVRRLKGVPLPADLGRRRLRLDNPVSGLPAPEPAGADVELHVALRPPGETLDPIVPLVGQSYLDVLKHRLADAGYDISLLTAGPDAPPPEVGPPVYGQLPVGRKATADALGSPTVPPWLSQLNLDPRLRVAAGLGAQVARNDQDHYLEVAWKQVGDVIAANRLRRRAEFSLATSLRLHTRWIAAVATGELLTATAPVHAKVWVAPNETIVGRLRDSPLVPAAVSVEFRRFTRDRGILSAAKDWRLNADVATLSRRSAEAAPLLQTIPIDGIDTITPPSALWGVEKAASILHALVPDHAAQADVELAARQLDGAAHPVAADMVAADQVADRLSAARDSVDTVLSAVGLLPVSEVAGWIAQPVEPPADPPADPPGRIRRRRGEGVIGPWQDDQLIGRLDDDDAIRPLGRQFGNLVDRDDLDRVVRRGGVGEEQAIGVRRFGGFERRFDNAALDALTPDLLAGSVSTVQRIVLAEPSLVRMEDERVVLDAASLVAQSRTGLAATTVDAASFEAVVAGLAPEGPQPASFGLDDPVRDAVFGQVVSAVAELAGKQIRGAQIGRPGRALEGGLESLRATVVKALDPRLTLTRAVNSRIAALLGEEAKVFDDIMVAPDLSEPTYGALAKISHDWLLPGIDALPTDTTTLVAANREFIASFLVGMNHELARELLWHEYPTDQRGTYARQFWTRKPTADRSSRYDLKHELHKAGDRTLARLTGDRGDPLVLVVKGDLVRRYPGVLITAAHTKAGPQGKRLLNPTTVVEPDFIGLLEPDVLLVGFEGLEEPMVRAAQDVPDEAWWFFFAEHFAEPRFGFDELVENNVGLGPDEVRAWNDPQRTWNDAAWQYATLDDRGFLTAASFDQNLRKGADDGSATKHRWGSDAAGQAWIALQFPFRRGVRAQQLLPPEEP